MQAPNRNWSILRTPIGRPSAPRIASGAFSLSRLGSDLRYSSIGASSTAGKRASLFSKVTSTQKLFDENRSLLDRSVQQFVVQKIQKFLIENNYAFYNEKLLKNPTTAEFARLFEFVMQHVDPGYMLTDKFQDEMPAILRGLGYPAQLKSATMQTIGVPHSMPHLLTAIAWLIDIANLTFEISPQELLLADEEGDGQKKSVSYSFSVQCFKKYCVNPEIGMDISNFQSENNALVQLIDGNEFLTEQEEELAPQIDAVNERISILRAEQGELGNLVINLRTAEEGSKQLKEKNDAIHGDLCVEEEKQASLFEQLEMVTKEIDRMKEDFEAQQQMLAAQKISGEEARAIVSRRDELKAEVEKMTNDLTKLKEEEQNMLKLSYKESVKLREKYMEFVRNFEDASRSITSIDNAFVSVLEKHSPNQPHFSDVIPEIEEYIGELINEVDKKMELLKDEGTKINKEINELKKRNADCSDQLKKFQHEMQRLSYEHSVKREDWQHDLQKATLEVDVAKNKLHSLQTVLTGKTVAHEQLAMARKQLETRQLEVEELKKSTAREVALTLEPVIAQWEELKAQYAQLRVGLEMITDEREKLMKALSKNRS